ncbi:phosphotransferase enzyme family protein [Aspergillus falconensis]
MLSGNEKFLQIPFYAIDLPCPLPTDAEIESAPDISMEYGGRRIVAVGQHFVVKFGLGVNLIEGENMLFTSPESGKNLIVMERMIGQTLLSAWPGLSPSEKESISSTLQKHFDQLRRLSSPKYFGSFGKRQLLDEIFWTLDADPLVNGPFNSEEDLNEAMMRKYIYNGGPRFRAEFFRHCFPHIFKGHEPTFTHGDLQRKNIIICDEGHAGNEAPSIAIIDWEKAGWYPSYWEYGMAVCALRWDDDWCLWIDSVLKPFVSEAAWFQSLRLELWS